EADIGRLVAADDAARTLGRDHGLRAGFEGFAAGVREVVAGAPAVVRPAGAALLEPARLPRRRAAALRGTQDRKLRFAIVAHRASLRSSCRSSCDRGALCGRVARSLAGTAFDTAPWRLAGRRLGRVPGAAGRRHHPQEARTGGHPQLAAG